MPCGGWKLPVPAGFAGAAASLFGGAGLRRRGTADELLEGRHRLLMPIPFGIRPMLPPFRPALVRFHPLLVAAVRGDAETPDAHGGGRGDGGSRGADDEEAGFGDGEVRCLVFGRGGEDRKRSPQPAIRSP